MKRLSILTLLVLSTYSVGAEAKAKVFTGNATYTKTGTRPEFTQLEQLGVQQAAELNGMGKCRQAGARDCVILGSQLTSCGLTGLYSAECSATAQIRGQLN